MLIIDTALQQRAQRGRPIRLGMIGAGFMGRGVVLNIIKSTPGIDLVAIANRHIGGAKQAYLEAGVGEVVYADNRAELESAIAAGRPAVTEDGLALCQAENVDVILEVTGAIEYGAAIALEAIRHGKHLLLMNAELDSTIGPQLKSEADRAGVVYTNVDGDQPGVILNLYRFVRGLGIRPVLCGNVKGLQDPYRNPTTQRAFAEKWGQKPHMVTSFADGTKISFEQAIVANATGMRVAQRGMLGPTLPPGTPLEKTTEIYPLEYLQDGPGIVDYVVGPTPNGGVFVLGMHDDPRQQHYLNLYKVGPGPLYCFYNPYHLCHFEVANTVARAALFQDAAVAPLEGPVVDVVATAKIDLKAGERLDGIGWYMTYGQAENADRVFAEKLLPMGLAEDCVLKRDIPRDTVLTYDDVILPPGRLVDRLRSQQDSMYFSRERTRPEVNSNRVIN
ncbi:Predicted homoserine dehydrogenase, contains C-terminal SAF domain [Microbulbifer donghaiensis]|uniref:Predicted homoserine dehydrogenase, contains C-terminal SAF domain n=1 Tax=Microbulbifer donghaiensis TaxID=494016 RepID=A0A1M4U8R9_9GAMM|nr:Gfo/Idh/MocA family oxidoreductase [Microbulbifer donghaiensis]SHE53172.1 Predicted homoserine dehydrogenase, contains C-terminal SAF domain [Microbulbifer donghaiensis]